MKIMTNTYLKEHEWEVRFCPFCSSTNIKIDDTLLEWDCLNCNRRFGL